jgi:DNA-binding CsgD family transcriptional regulator
MITKKVLVADRIRRMTDRELEISNLLVQRLNNKKTAAKLFISPQTVKKHLDNIYSIIVNWQNKYKIDSEY